jgi:predicted transcriptional regulator
MSRGVAELRFIAQSDNRADAIQALSRETHLERRELETRLDASHRTVIRIVNSLEERGYLRETDRGLELTPFGSRMASSFREFLDDASTAIECKPLLRHAPAELGDLPLERLASAELVVASAADPFGIMDRVLSLRAEATRIREVAPGVQTRSVEQLAERVRNGEAIDVEAVIPRRASELAESREEYRTDHAATVESAAVDIYVHPGAVPLFAATIDDRAAVAVAKDGQPHALAVSDDPEFRAAVESLFERYRDEATLKSSV